MDVKIVILTVLFKTVSAQTVVQTAEVIPSAPENVLFQLTSHDSFVIAWSATPEPFDFYVLEYYPDGVTKEQIAINKTENHYDVVDPTLNLKTLGVNFYTVFGDTRSDPANINVLTAHDALLPPAVTSATKQWVSNSTIQLQWTLPPGQYDTLLLLYAPEHGGVTAQSAVLDKTTTSYKIQGLSHDVLYTIHLYTIRNGIHSDPSQIKELAQSEKACETNPYPCKNEGECVEDENDPHIFTCECNTGFNGTLCENNIDDCVPNPCKNGGQCIDAISDFACVCAKGFTGRNCEVETVASVIYRGIFSGAVGLRGSGIVIGLMATLCGIIIWKI